MENNSGSDTSTAPVTEAEPTESTDTEPAQVVAAPVSTKKKMKIKVDDKEEDFEYDPNDEAEMRRHFQMSKVAQKRMSESTQIKKQANDFFQKLKSDPASVLADPRLGVDFRKVAEEYLQAQLEEQMLTPEEKRLRQAEQIIRQREEESKRQQEEQESAQAQQLQAHYAQHFEKVIIDALSTGGVPKTKGTVKRMAELLKKNLDGGYDLDPKHLAKMVKEDYERDIREMFESADDDQLLALMGDNVSNKIRKADLKRLKGSQPQGFQQTRGKGQTVRADKPSEKMSTEEWREMIAKKLEE